MKKNVIITLILITALGLILYWARIAALNPPQPKKAASHTQSATGRQPLNFSDMMNALSQNMEIWENLSADEKEIAVNAVIQLYAQQNRVKISRDAGYYVYQMNQSLAANEEFKRMPIDRLLFIIAVMAYDFDNGSDPDVLARETLGPEIYEANRLRRQQMELTEEFL